MIELSAPLSTAPVAPGRPQLLAALSAESFAVALNALAVPGAAVALPGDSERQPIADTGKNLPADTVSGPNAGGDDHVVADVPDAMLPTAEAADAQTVEFPTTRLIAAKPGRATKTAGAIKADPTSAPPAEQKTLADVAQKPRERRKPVAPDADGAVVTPQPAAPVQPLMIVEPERAGPDLVAPTPPPAQPATSLSETMPMAASSPLPARQTVSIAVATVPQPTLADPAVAPEGARGENDKTVSNDLLLQGQTTSPQVTAAGGIASHIAENDEAVLPSAQTSLASSARSLPPSAAQQPTVAGRHEAPPAMPLASEEILAALRPVVLDAPAPAQPGQVQLPFASPISNQTAPAGLHAALETAPALFHLAIDPAPRRFRSTEAAPVTLLTPAEPAALPSLVPVAAADQPMLDTGRQEWTGQMIDMIQAMQDEAPLKETRMRLAPEALGKVDITVRQDGDRVHVNFHAETQVARQMLAEAQPRLAEIAEQRGLKLGQTTVEGGASGQGHPGQRQEAEARQPGRPASARSRDDTERKPTLTDERIA